MFPQNRVYVCRTNGLNDELDPIELRYKMNWTLERLALELDYSVSAALKWSAGINRPSRRARKQAYQVWLSHNPIHN